MTPRHLYPLLLVLVAISSAAAQSEDELQIPVENDNQFPPDQHSDILEGSGNGVLEEPEESAQKTTEAIPPPIEHIQQKLLLDDLETGTPSEGDDLCPKPCVCRIEGSSNDFVVDCSGYDLTEFPAPINDKTTVLNIQRNKLTEIPKEISALKNLKVLNANDNSISTVASGSISELPELVILKLENNRLIEYPTDLKNGFGLTKLEELYLGGNDMRTELTSDLFSKFESLRKLILPTSTTELQQDLCEALPKSLETICTGTCENALFECRDDEVNKIDEDIPVLPGTLTSTNDDKDEADPTINTTEENIDANENPGSDTQLNNPVPTDASKIEKTANPPAEFSFRSAVNKQPNDVEAHSAIVESPKDASGSTEAPVKIGATKSDVNTEGVDKSIIGLVVAGMVVIVAGITIKKNWSSIKNRFSSNNRTSNDRNGVNANGATTPEEVPLQDKSPV